SAASLVLVPVSTASTVVRAFSCSRVSLSRSRRTATSPTWKPPASPAGGIGFVGDAWPAAPFVEGTSSSRRSATRVVMAMRASAGPAARATGELPRTPAIVKRAGAGTIRAQQHRAQGVRRHREAHAIAVDQDRIRRELLVEPDRLRRGDAEAG